MNKHFLSLAELESFDGRSPKQGRERRFACPLCGRNKPLDAAHRSLAVNTENGSFFCHRCQIKGKLKEFWQDKTLSFVPKKLHTRRKIMAQFAVGDANFENEKISNIAPKKKAFDEISDLSAVKDLAEKMNKYQTDFLHSPAEIYLIERGIDTETAIRARCGYAEKWEHWQKEGERWFLQGTDRRVVFPIYDVNGNLVAFHGRAIDSEHIGSAKITRGDKSQGLFLTARDALDAPIFAVCEGAADAMSLAMCGISAVAMTGTTPPDWLYRKAAFKSVLLATDADESGDKSALKMKNEMQLRASKTFRLRSKNAKDWSEVLEKIGVIEMRKIMSAFAYGAGDEERFHAVIKLLEAEKVEAAAFITHLIGDFSLQESLLHRIRRKNVRAA